MGYQLAKLICWIFLRLVFRIKVHFAKGLPQAGGVLVVANHSNLIDPLIVGTSLHRPVHFMAKQELFNIPVLNKIIRGLGAFPVRRGAADRTAIESSFKILSDGGVMGMFPEGTRYRDGRVHELRSGAAALAIRTGCPVLPMIIVGANDISLFKWRKIHVFVGQPIILPESIPGESDKERHQFVTRLIKGAMDNLCEEAQQIIGHRSGKLFGRSSEQSGVIRG
jgi:1-acyl-sn-glycerol-3-phosphate acyltransferase